MRHLLLICILLASCQSQDPATVNTGLVAIPVSDIHQIITAPPSDEDSATTIAFDAPVFNFGEVIEGTTVEHVFEFKNSGDLPLLISDAQSTCGCTVPEWPKTPIDAGQTGRMVVRFDTEGKIENQVKKVTITANTYPGQTEIALIGKVIPKLSETDKKQ